MTCAHVVNVGLKKMSGVETVDVSLNKGLATVKLKPGNTASVPQFWQLLHEKGYTPKATTVIARGELAAYFVGIIVNVSPYINRGVVIYNFHFGF